jgi:DNA-binding response OmpR family regulator
LSAVNKSAWVVDDDDSHIHPLQIMLKNLDYDCKIYTSATEVKDDIINGFTPDLLLIDVHLPDNSALDLISYIRDNDLLDDPPIIVLDDDFTEESEYAIQIGADDELIFPLIIQELEGAISNACERRNLEDILEDEEEF